MITGINKSKTLTKHAACECICNFDGWKCNSNQKSGNNKCRCECKNLKKDDPCKKRLNLDFWYMCLWKL